MSRGNPGFVASVEHCNSLMSDPAQQPPQSRSVGAVIGIVGNDLGLRRHSPASQRVGEILWRRQWMPTCRGCDRTGQIAIQMRVDGIRIVTFRIGGFADRRFAQFETAVDDEPVPILYMRGEIGDGNESGEHRRVSASESMWNSRAARHPQSPAA